MQSKSEISHLFVGNEGTDGQTRDTVIFLTMIFFLHFVLSHTPSVYQLMRFYSHCLPSLRIPAQLFKTLTKQPISLGDVIHIAGFQCGNISH